MILTTHIMTGALIGAELKNPYVIAGASVAIHFLMDKIPHGDYLNKNSKCGEFWKVGVDLLIGLGLVAFALFQQDIASMENFYIRNIAIGIFFSLLPDGTTFLYWKMGMKFLAPIKRFHENLHYHPEFSSKRKFRIKNNLWDIAITLIFFVILLSL